MATKDRAVAVGSPVRDTVGVDVTMGMGVAVLSREPAISRADTNSPPARRIIIKRNKSPCFVDDRVFIIHSPQNIIKLLPYYGSRVSVVIAARTCEPP
jgi:hypothetical protein